MFFGHHKHAVDSKGRLSIPKRFLEPLAEPSQPRLFFGTRGLEQCIFLFLSTDWQQIVQQVRQASLGDDRVRGFSRTFFSFARELAVDGTGRVLLPPEYRDFLGNEKEVVLAGVDRRIELWTPPAWEDELRRGQAGYEVFAREIFRA